MIPRSEYPHALLGVIAHLARVPGRVPDDLYFHILDARNLLYQNLRFARYLRRSGTPGGRHCHGYPYVPAFYIYTVYQPEIYYIDRYLGIVNITQDLEDLILGDFSVSRIGRSRFFGASVRGGLV